MKYSVLSKLRRLMALALALLLIASLIGCSKKEEPEDPVGTEGQTQSTDPIPDLPTLPPTEPPVEIPTEAPQKAVMGTVGANNLNVRSNPSIESTVLSQLPDGLRIEILEQREVTNNDGSVTNWGRIGEMTLSNGKKINGGWINMSYVKLDSTGDNTGTNTGNNNTPSGGNTGTNTGNTSTGTGKMGTVTATELNIRKSTSTSSDSVGAYLKGDRVEILEQKTVDGTIWGRTIKGWVSMKYIKLDGASNTGTTDTDKEDNKTSSSEIISNGKTKVLGYAVIDLDSLNVRSGPGTKYDKVGTVSEGDRYAYYQESGNWIRIKNGWVGTSYVYIEGTNGNNGGTGTVTADGLNLRSGPGTGYKSKGSVKKGDTLAILAQVNGWGYTRDGWVSMKHIKLAAPSYPTGSGKINTDGLNIRKEPNKDAEKVGTYNEGDKVTITEVKDGWGKTDKGWINMKYVEMGIGGNTTFKKGKATVNVQSSLNIRKDANKDSESLGYLKNGELVDVLEVKGEWGKIEYEKDKFGWINLEYVKY